MSLHETVLIFYTLADVGDERDFELVKNTPKIIITRVPGGWVYEFPSGDNFTSTFVAYHNEFQSESQQTSEEPDYSVEAPEFTL